MASILVTKRSIAIHGFRRITKISSLYNHSTSPVPRWQRSIASLAEKTRSDDTFAIPVVDFGKYLSPSQSARKETAKEIVDAFKEVGFVYLKNHGIENSTITHAFKKSDEFFNMSTEKKAKLAWEDPRANRGYVQPGRERVTQSSDPAEIAALKAKAPDSKETMEIGRDWDPTWKNQWPQESDAPEFKATFLNFFQTCHDLHSQVMRSIALGLDLEETYFDHKINEQFHNLRLLSYPSIDTRLLKSEGQARAGAHSDYGTLTFVFQDAVGGLEVQNPHTQVFHPATPIPGTIVVNVGDLLARWSNDVFRSTLHRVVAPPAINSPMTPHRQSIAFFCNPNGGAEISCLPTCTSADRPPKYPSIRTDEYIVGRLSATYGV